MATEYASHRRSADPVRTTYLAAAHETVPPWPTRERHGDRAVLHALTRRELDSRQALRVV